MGDIVLITGGVRSGKSVLAEKLAQRYKRVIYIATCEAKDDEMIERIHQHRQRRSNEWTTVEVTTNLIDVIQRLDTEACLLLDCLGLWVSNCLLIDEEKNLTDPEGFIRQMRENTSVLVTLLASRQGDSVLVTNEVGFGLVPPYKLGRIFRDCLGIVNAKVAEAARDVYLCAVGIPVALKKDWEVQLG
jgi:adenosylcobinamide kinase/adenosylcobinamide-phosphate guanylyltransferase